MASVIEDGSIDIVGLARPIALEPDFPRDVLAGRTEPSRCNSPRNGGQMLAAATENAWHQQQLRRMARGDEPSVRLQRWHVLFGPAWRMACS
jgi:hypothetical protein